MLGEKVAKQTSLHLAQLLLPQLLAPLPAFSGLLEAARGSVFGLEGTNKGQ